MPERTETLRVQPNGSGPGSRGHTLLVIDDGPPLPYRLADGARATVGRADEADIRIDRPWGSRRHALLVAEGGRVFVEDLGSVNGTRVRGIALLPGQPTELHPGEAIEIGRTLIVLQRAADDLVPGNALSSADFEARLGEECGRAAKYGLVFSVVRVQVPEPVAETTLLGLLGGVLRPMDALSPLGEGAFEMLLVGYSAVETQAVMRRIVEHLEARGLSCRIGSATFPRDGQAGKELLRAIRAVPPVKRSAAASALPQVVVRSAKMRELHELIERVAQGRINVLLLGETGVGKEVLAEAVHRHSPRAERPFLRLNCGAFTEALLESELFGHERGAFTGATGTKPGLLETAQGGTVFLDEVGELPLALQVKLLRVLEERQVRRVGGVKSIPIDVRLVAATNRNLQEEIAASRFRADLYFRLDGITVRIPPLRERTDEIEDLARTFLADACKLNGIANVPELSREALDTLLRHPWPGNIRELRNAMERAAFLCGGDVVEPSHIPLAPPPPAPAAAARPARDMAHAEQPPPPPTLAAPMRQPAGPLEDQLAEVEKQRIMTTLEQFGGNQSRTARALGISRRRLTARLEAWGVPRPRKSRDPLPAASVDGDAAADHEDDGDDDT
jgi:DNA-binding NtrC family response regulator